MKSNKLCKLVILILTSIIFFTPLVSSEHLEYHETYELPEGYFQGIQIDNLFDYDIEMEITSNYKIDVVILTDAEYNACCATGETTQILFTDSRTKLSTDDTSIIVPSGEDGYILVIDNTDAVVGGEDPNVTVTVNIYYLEYFEMPEYSFNFIGFLLGIIFIPLTILAGIDIFGKYGWTEKVLNFNIVKIITLYFERFKMKNPEKYISKYPILTILILVNIIWYLLGLITGQYSDEGNQYEKWINLGATNFWELFQGNLFSLITSNFMHFNFEHLFFNMVSLYFLGDYIEKELGSIKFISFIFFTGLCSSIIGLMGLGTGGGASGVVFALIGMISGQVIIEKIKNLENHCTFPDMKFFGYTILMQSIPFVMWVSSGESGGVSHLGHLGGFLGGMVFGIFIINSENTIPRYEEMTVAQLKEILRGRDLPVSGAKYLLIERLNEFDMSLGEYDNKVEDNNEWKMNIKDILFSFEGRINRQIWWYSSILLGLVYGLVILVFEFAILRALLNSGFILSTLLLILYIPFYYINVALTIKRLKDTNRGWELGFFTVIASIISGLMHYLELFDINNTGILITTIFLLLTLIFLSLPIVIVCGFYKGTNGPNQYGDDPLNSQGYITIEELNDEIITAISSNENDSSFLDFFTTKSRQFANSWEVYKQNKTNQNLEYSNLNEFERWVITHPLLYLSMIFLICVLFVSIIFTIF